MCLSKDVTGHCSLFSIFTKSPLFTRFSFSLSHSVSVQRRDRSLFSSLHFFTKAPLLARFFRFSLGSSVSLLVLCLRFLFAVCLSKDVADTLFPLLILIDLPATFSSFCLHSVSVQRRDRCSVSSSFCLLAPFYLKFSWSLLVTQCICPKTWQVSVTDTTYLSFALRTPSPPTFFKLFDLWLSFCDFLCEST